MFRSALTVVRRTQQVPWFRRQVLRCSFGATFATMSDFVSTGLSKDLLDSVSTTLAEFDNRPTEAQAASIPALLAGKNIVIGSETGSGKTLAYTLPLLDLLRSTDSDKGRCKPQRPRALILLPSRELALQVCRASRVSRNNGLLQDSACFDDLSIPTP